MTTTGLTEHHVKVLQAIKLLHKPWSVHGGATLDEIARHADMTTLRADMLLTKLILFKHVIALKQESPKRVLMRYYRNIYPSVEKL